MRVMSSILSAVKYAELLNQLYRKSFLYFIARKPLIIVLFIGVVGSGLWWFGSGQQINHPHLEVLAGDPIEGLYIFRAAGCATCHVSPQNPNQRILAGGQAFESEFGTFYAPNVSMSKTFGIGNWSVSDFANALREGVSPKNEHYYPAFPYTSYRLISDQDLVDLWSFWKTLPAVETASLPHDIPWPLSVRSSLAFWKLINFKTDWVKTEVDERGRYLVEALGHCAECHTPRNVLGGLKRNSWMAGTTAENGKVLIPGISPEHLNWTENEIVEYLATGFTPEFDVAGGKMAKVIENTSKFWRHDLKAIARYLRQSKIKVNPPLSKGLPIK